MLMCRRYVTHAQATRFAFVEFNSMEAASNALVLNGMMFKDRPLKYVYM